MDKSFTEWVESAITAPDNKTMITVIADGTTDQFEINFPGGYLNKSHIKGYIVDEEELTRTDLTLVFIRDNLIKVAPFPKLGDHVTLYRDTPKEVPLVSFTDGAMIAALNLDRNAKQCIFAVAEMLDRFGVVYDQVELAEMFAKAAAESAATAQAQAAFVDAIYQKFQLTDQMLADIALQVENARQSASLSETSAHSAEIYRNEARDFAEAASFIKGMYQNLDAVQKDITDGLLVDGDQVMVYSAVSDVVASKYKIVGGVPITTGEDLRTDTYVGRPCSWSNINMDVFDSINQNTVKMKSGTAYQEARGNIQTVPAGTTVDVYYKITVVSGEEPWVRLHTGGDWASSPIRLTRTRGMLKATLTATADATQVRLYSGTGATVEATLFMFMDYRNSNSVTSAMIALLSEAEQARTFAEKAITSTGLTSFKGTSPNTFEFTGAGDKYTEISIALMPIASGNVFKIRHRIESTSDWTHVRLWDSAAQAWGSAEVVIPTDGITTTADIPTVPGYRIDTIKLYTKVQATKFAGNGFLGILAVGDLYYSATGAYSGMSSEDLGVGITGLWKNQLFDSVQSVGRNQVNYKTNTSKFGEARASVSLKQGESITVYFRCKTKTGDVPFLRLRNGAGWASDEVKMSESSAVSAVTLTATVDASLLSLYTKATGASEGSVWLIAKGPKVDSSILLASNLSDSIISVAPFAENGKPKMSGLDFFRGSSNNSWTFYSDGTKYTEVAVSLPQQPLNALLGVNYSVKSNGAFTYIRLRSGISWAGDETPIVTDGTSRVVELRTTAGMRADSVVVYSRTQAPYNGDAFVCLSSVNNIYVSPVTAYNALSGSSDGSEDLVQNTSLLFPDELFLVAERGITLFGSNLVEGKRPWDGGSNVTLTSIPTTGGSCFMRYSQPDASFYPEDIKGDSIVVNARKNTGADAFRKTSKLTVVPKSTTETISVCALMDSHGFMCVPWIVRAVNSTGATYKGVGMYNRDMGDGTSVPFEGRAGWSTFSYMGRRPETTFTNPFLKEATQQDFLSHPQWCYASDYSGVSYAQNPGLGSYHVFDVTAWKAARGLSTNSKLVVVMQLGVNDRWRGYPAVEVAAAQDFMIKQFKAVLPDVRFVVSSHALGWTSASEWDTYTPYIREKLIKFDGRVNENILQAPAWAFQSGKFGWAEVVGTTTPPGNVKFSLGDDIHPGDLGCAQWGDAQLGPVLAAWFK